MVKQRNLDDTKKVDISRELKDVIHFIFSFRKLMIQKFRKNLLLFIRQETR